MIPKRYPPDTPDTSAIAPDCGLISDITASSLRLYPLRLDTDPGPDIATDPDILP